MFILGQDITLENDAVLFRVFFKRKIERRSCESNFISSEKKCKTFYTTFTCRHNLDIFFTNLQLSPKLYF